MEARPELASSTSCTPLRATQASRRSGRCHPVRAEDAEGLLELARTLEIDLVVVGPEAPLVAGVADELRHGGVSVFGPSATAAQIEGSKSFAKTIMAVAGVANPRELSEPQAPCVVKVDGLASGKGVFVCRTEAELAAGLRAAASLGDRLVVEELLEGDELSVFALCDGSRALPLGAARDYKRAEDGDAGPNTGGMGSYSPVEGFSPGRIAELVDEVHAPVLEQLARRGAPFIGVLFAGLMLTENGPQVLEFNCRLGDPEAQTILAAHDDDLLPALAAAAAGDAAGFATPVDGRAAVTVVVTAGSYPETGDAGSADRRRRGCRGDRRARLPCGHGATRGHAGHERRTHSRGHRPRRVGHRGARAGLCRRRADLVPRRQISSRHRQWLSEPLVGILIGSESDRERMQAALDELAARGIACELEVRSAHRQPDAVAEYARGARERGIRVLIAGAGLAAALPGVVAAHTDLPVIGVPLRSSLSVGDGLDALLSIVQMPPGVPVACVGVDNAKNAAVLAARILGA